MLRCATNRRFVAACAPVALWVAVAGALGGCPRSAPADAKKSQIHLDLAIDAFSRTPLNLDLVEDEASKAIAYMATNDEAYNVRGLARLKRAMDAKHGMEVSACLTGLDAEAQQQVIDEQFTLAGQDFQRATEVAPDYSEAWFNRGNVALGQGDPELAIQHITKALENPIRLIDATTARATLGSALLESGDEVGAAKELRQALQFKPGYCLARLWLGQVYFARQEWDKAGELLEGIVDDASCRSLQEAPLYLMKTRISQGLLDDAQRAKAACLSTSTASCVALECASLAGPAAAATPSGEAP